MNVVLWVVQVLLALLYGAGGGYKLSSADALAGQFPALPAAGWRGLGLIEMVGAGLLIVPAATKWMPVLTPVAAGVLAVEALALSALYAKYSLKVEMQNPLVFSVVMAVLAIFVAYGRYALRPVV